jgi:hypothetical protein
MRDPGPRLSREGGQATVEWAGLVLLAALVLGAAAALAVPRPQHGRELGAALAGRITGAAAAAGAAAPRGRSASRPQPPAPAAPRRISRARAAAALQRLRGVAAIAKRAWIVCLGYKRFRYELAHPQVVPTEAMPLDEALRIADDCLNPYAFLGSE